MIIARPSLLWAAACLSLLSAVSCSLTDPSVLDCASETNPDQFCAMSFGVGSICARDGFCSALGAVDCREQAGTPQEQDAYCGGELGFGARCGEDGACEAPPDGLVDCRTQGDDEVERDAYCRETEGLAFSCAPDGLCQQATLRARCTDIYPKNAFDEPLEYKGAVVLGALYDYVSHRDTLRATQLAIIEATTGANDGINGRDIVLVSCDYGSGLPGEEYEDGVESNDAARDLASFLANELGVPAILGPRGSSRTQAAFQGANSMAEGDPSVVVISPSATSPSLTLLEPAASDEAPGLLWRTAPPDSLQGAAIAQDVQRRDAILEAATGSSAESCLARNGIQSVSLAGEGISEIAFVYQDSSYATGLLDVFENRLGSGYAINRFSFAPGEQRDQQFTTAVTAALASDYDEIMFISSDGADIEEFLSLPNLEDTIGDRTIFLADAAYRNDIVDSVRQAGRSSVLDNIRGSRPFTERNAVFNAFSTRYFTQFREEVEGLSAFTPNAYDAAWLVLYGAIYADHVNEGAITGRGIARGIRKVTVHPDAVERSIGADSFGAVAANLRADEDVNIQGASGLLDYDPQTEETSSDIQIWVVGDDEQTPRQQFIVKPSEELPAPEICQ